MNVVKKVALVAMKVFFFFPTLLYKKWCIPTSFFLCVVFMLPCSFSYANKSKTFVHNSLGQSAFKKSKKGAPGSQFYATVLKMYHSDDPLLRATAYLDTINIPDSPLLIKELRRQRNKKHHDIEHFILLYSLAVITRTDKDIEALFAYIFSKGSYILTVATDAEGWRNVNVITFLRYYGELARNPKYQRRAWLCGVACSTFYLNYLSFEVAHSVERTFPEGTEVPYSLPEDDGTFKFSDDKEATRVTKEEVEWFTNFGKDYAEAKMYEGEGPYENWKLKEAKEWSLGKSWESAEVFWDTFFTTLVPLLDMGGKDAELARAFVSQETRGIFPEGLFERFYPEGRKEYYMSDYYSE